MTINAVQQAAFRGSPHFVEAVNAVAMEKALYKIATLSDTPTDDERKAAEYSKRLVQNRRSPNKLVGPLVARSTWDLTFDTWAAAEATGDRYAIGAGLDELWPIFAETV